ncbi:MAG: tetratricopeptide repeat protein [Rhodospirillaceae bacterium]|nr:tetratricopeptide repeat protein [Rhodospirillaceae bacterium]
MSRQQLEKGLALHQEGKLDEAAEIYQEVLAVDPGNADALHFLGLIAQQRGDLSAAIEHIEAAISAEPERPTFHFNLGVTFTALGNLAAAAAAYEKAGKLKPDWLDAWVNLGSTLGQLKKYAAAETALRQALEIDPKNVSALIGLTAAMEGQGQSVEAEEIGRAAIALDASSPEAWTNFGNALSSQGKLSEAEDAFRQAVSVDPSYSTAGYNLGNVLDKQWRLSEALASYRQVIEADPNYLSAWQNMLLNLLYETAETEASIFAAHQAWSKQFALDDAAVPAAKGPQDRRLKIGYVSPDFRTHSCAYFLKPLFAAHDREAFEIYVYSNLRREDETTPWFKDHADHWCDIVDMSDSDTAERIREDKIDILVDLAGHSANNRLGIFALKPAAVQISWLGYPATTGLPEINYRLTDEVADPTGEADNYHSEQLIRLEDGFHCYQPAETIPDVNPLPALENGYVTFGSFNHTSKITSEVVEIWSQLLTRVPTSKILLKGRQLDSEIVQQKIYSLFENQGISAERITLSGWIPRDQNPLALYHQVDICLDTFPYNGTTTSFEALTMGAPVITLRGARHAGRVGASILTHLGRSEWIAETPADYVEKANEIASDLPVLQEIRAGLRAELQQSSLANATDFAAKIEAVYQEICQQKL